MRVIEPVNNKVVINKKKKTKKKKTYDIAQAQHGEMPYIVHAGEN